MNSLILWAALGLLPFVPASVVSQNAGCPKCECCGCCDTGGCACTSCTCACCVGECPTGVAQVGRESCRGSRCCR
ncbi:MAG: hypothetical protein EBX36_12285 [Planctomycetia bacterium]|nr:hypothetical protein [Planctomycetia bacterium]